MLGKQLSRLFHRLKITVGQSVYPVLSFLYKFRIGSAARLVEVLSNSKSLPGCESLLLLHPTSLPVKKVEYFIPGSAEEEHLEKLKVPVHTEARATCSAGIISVKDIAVSLPLGMHLHKGKVFDEAFIHSALLTNPKYVIDLEAIPFKKKIRITEPVVLLNMPWHHNLYHWLLETLPRLLLYEQASSIKGLPLVMPTKVAAFVRESLELAGYLDKVLFLDDGVYQFEQLHLLSRLSPTSMPSPAAIKWLNHNLSVPGESPKGRRIYVSRADAKYRFVTNEVEVQKLLSEYGFETVVLSEYSLEQKVKIFQQAEMVIGSSGAGFTGIAFMQPGSLLVEFFPEGHFADCFYNLANLIGLEYGFLIGKKDGLGFSIDVTQLRKIMEKVMANSSPI